MPCQYFPIFKKTEFQELNTQIQIMKRNIYLKILLGIVAIVLLVKFITVVFIEPWVGKKIQTTFNEKYSDYIVEIDKVHISLFTSALELENLTIGSKLEHGGLRDFNGEIASIKFKGVSLVKFLFKNDIDIREIIISNSSIKGKMPFPEKSKPQKISTLNILIDSIRFDKIDVAIENTLNTKAFSVKEGVLKVYDLHVEKQDTLSPAILKNFDFKAEELSNVSADSMYTFTASGIVCSATSNTLVLDSFSVHPNYKDYDFTARHKFQTDRIEADFTNIFVHDFSATAYFKSGSVVSSYIGIGKMDMKAFRDTRKEFRHVNIPAFQDMIYKYPGTIRIDSIGLLSGNVTYSEHVEKAKEPGVINFNEINAKIYKITNDTIFKTEKAYLKLNAEGLLMGKGKITILLKGRIFDSHNTFSLNGTLSGMDAKELNPMLGKNAFIYATSGKIDAMNFSLTANNAKATGKMKLLYHGLDIAVKNKRTDDTTAITARVSSLIANMIILNSNPIPGEAVREGLIDYKRDPERFLFNYCAKSILTGIKSTLIKSPKK